MNALIALLMIGVAAEPQQQAHAFNDSHLHLTNYVQEGVDLKEVLALMGTRVERAALFGIPLQQQWSSRISADHPPTYYLESDAPLYYYSFTDAVIATAVLALPADQRARFDPMITGFNPADMYAVDHVRRVLRTFPGVFEGIGEFSIHKEFVTSKVAGEPPSLLDPALDRLLDLAAEAGLVVLIHNDITTPFPKEGARPAYFEQLRALLLRHAGATVIWAHAGLGRVIEPVANQVTLLDGLLSDPRLPNLHIDLSWIETAKHLVQTPESVRQWAGLIRRHPDRFLFGSDAVAPESEPDYLETYAKYAPLWRALAPDVRDRVLKGNYVRVFDEARRRVRAWERVK